MLDTRPLVQVLCRPVSSLSACGQADGQLPRVGLLLQGPLPDVSPLCHGGLRAHFPRPAQQAITLNSAPGSTTQLPRDWTVFGTLQVSLVSFFGERCHSRKQSAVKQM